jgi:hypothetical protein
MPEPTDIQGVQRISGVINYLGRFIPNMSEKLELLRSLTRADSEFVWNADQSINIFYSAKTCMTEVKFSSSIQFNNVKGHVAEQDSKVQ